MILRISLLRFLYTWVRFRIRIAHTYLKKKTILFWKWTNLMRNRTCKWALSWSQKSASNKKWNSTSKNLLKFGFFFLKFELILIFYETKKKFQILKDFWRDMKSISQNLWKFGFFFKFESILIFHGTKKKYKF